jgi:hypothetical protein
MFVSITAGPESPVDVEADRARSGRSRQHSERALIEGLPNVRRGDRVSRCQKRPSRLALTGDTGTSKLFRLGIHSGFLSMGMI